jgi:hypothetical protein
MIAFEQHARLLLVLHALCALAVVALSTHLVVWMHRFFVRGKGSRRSVVRFALLSTSFFGLAMLLGLAIYPTYKVRVRTQYLENPSAIRRSLELDNQVRQTARERDLESLRYRTGEVGRAETQARDDDALARHIESSLSANRKAARWFDVKEHWAALGLLLSAATLLILLTVRRAADVEGLLSTLFLLAIGAMSTAWFAAVVGILTAARRSV